MLCEYNFFNFCPLRDRGRGSGIEGKSNEGHDRWEVSVHEQDKKFRDAANLNTFLS